MKFNSSTKGKETVQNYEGAQAYTLTPEYELYTAVVTTGLNPSFYEKGADRLKRIQSLIGKCNPEFVGKLAVYARNAMNLRSIPLVLSVELAKTVNGNDLVSKTVNGVVQRADEIAELLACYQMSNERTGTKKLGRLSKQVQKGLSRAFNRFDEYQFAKYNTQAEVKLRDALFLVHPKASNEAQQELFNKIAADTLATPYTWETEFSELGKAGFENEMAKRIAFAAKWEDLIESKKLGYMALLRNLRNIMEAGVSETHMEMVCRYLSDAKAVAGSRQLPFRFLAAYRELKEMRSGYTAMVLDALEDAVSLTAANIKGFHKQTSVLIACDVSSSMQIPVSPKSKILLYDIGLLLGMLLQSQCDNVISGMFGDKWKVINMPRRSILGNVHEYYRKEGQVGYSTNGYLVIEDLISRKEIVDKVMLFTDVQLWNSNGTQQSFARSWNDYKQMAPGAKLYLFDLAGHGTTPLDMKQNDVYLIAGWSDKIFDMLDALENGNSIVQQIHKIELE